MQKLNSNQTHVLRNFVIGFAIGFAEGLIAFILLNILTRIV